MLSKPRISLTILLLIIHLTAFATPDTINIQLDQLQRTDGGLGLGINLNIGGGPTSLFLLDTGSTPLAVSSGQVGSNAAQVIPIVPFDVHYTSGIHYTGTVYQGSVTLSGYGVTANNVSFGNITCASGGPFSTTCPGAPCPNASVCFPIPDTPPIYGTCGASLQPGSNSLYTLLAQLPGNLSSGFIIQTGGISGTPMLTIGLTDANRQGFITAQLPANGTFPNGNIAWNDQALNVTTNLSFGGSDQSVTGTVIFDTGDPDTTIRPAQATPPTTIENQFLNGSQIATDVLVNNVVNNAFNWTNIAGTTESFNIIEVSSTPALSDTYMNSGIDTFFFYDVMFDITNGLLGFRPIEQQDVSGLPNNSVISSSLGDLNGIPTALIQSGPGNVILSGNNTYSNGTILSGGSLTINSDTNLGSNGGVIFNGGTLNVDANYATNRSISIFSNGGIFNTNSFTSNLSGPLSGTGTLTKVGRGSLIYSGTQAAPFSGEIDIVEGVFIAEGSLSAATIDVEPSGTLMGTGPVGNVNSSGVVNPGLSPGILEVLGNYNQDQFGTLVIELASLASYDQLIVGQTAQLGGTLQPVSFNGFLPIPGSTFNIITAGSVVGQFSNISLLWPTLEVVPVYDPGQVTILINRNYANPQLRILNRNEIAFGNMLNALSLDPGVEGSLLSMINSISSATVLKETYDNLIPSQYLTQTATAFNRTTVTLANIDRRLHDLPRDDCFEGSLDLEVRELYQRHRHTELEHGYSLKGEQVNLEFDYALTSDLLLGLYGDYTHSRTTFHHNKGTIQNNSGAIFGYALYQKCGWYSDLILGGLFHSYRNNRGIDIFGTQFHAHSHNSAGEFAGQLTLGYEYFNEDGWSIDPYFLLQSANICGSSFTESGAFFVNMGGKIREANSLQTGLGVDLKQFFSMGENISSVEAFAEWRHECIESRYSMESRLLDSSIFFEVVSARPERDWGLAGANFNVEITSCLDCYLSYQTLFCPRTWLQCFSGGLIYLF